MRSELVVPRMRWLARMRLLRSVAQASVGSLATVYLLLCWHFTTFLWMPLLPLSAGIALAWRLQKRLDRRIYNQVVTWAEEGMHPFRSKR